MNPRAVAGVIMGSRGTTPHDPKEATHPMRKLFALLIAALFLATSALPLLAEEPAAEAAPVEGEAAAPAAAEAHDWLEDFEAAKKIAAEKKIPILIDFSGSDWCGWCVKLDQEVFSQEAFKAYAKENLVLMLADFPNAKPQDAAVKEQNAKLQEKFKIQGYPTIVLVGAEGEEIARTGYRKGGPEAYVEHLKELLAKKE